MKKLLVIGLAIMLLALGVGTAALAGEDSIPAAGAAFASSEITGFVADPAYQPPEGWEQILQGQIKTGQPKDLVITVSAETFLGTYAQLNGAEGSESTGEVQVRVLVDGNPVLTECLDDTYVNETALGAITFDNRLLRLEGDLTHDFELSPGDQTLTIGDHWIAVYISSASAHSFNFIATDVGQGTHDVIVEARLYKAESDYGEKGKKGSGEVYAAIGHVNAVINEVMFKMS